MAAATTPAQSNRAGGTCATTVKAPLVTAEICDARTGLAAGRWSDCYSDERLECLGRWKG
jgi:hypothetical protein